MLLVFLGEPLSKEGLCAENLLGSLLTIRMVMVFSMFMTQKKKNHRTQPSVSKFTSCFDTVMLFHTKHLFSTTSASGTTLEL